MASSFQRLQPKVFPAPESERKRAADLPYWKRFQFPRIIKEYSAINYVDFSPVQPYDYAVTCSSKIQIFGAKNHEVLKTSSRNKENVYGARFRRDGQLLVVGGDSGLVQVLAANSRAILRSLKGHTRATHVCCFSSDLSTIFSGSDDKTVRVWDMPQSKEVSLLKGHKDYVRCGCVHPVSSDLFVTGSYDHCVKLWDTRSGKEVYSLDHGQPVESVLVSKTGVCYSSGGNFIRVWDVRGSGSLQRQFSNHQKTITCMCFDGEQKRLLTGGLDRHVKVYDVVEYSVVASLDYPSPVLAVGLSPDSANLVVGMSDGAISVRSQPAAKESVKEPSTKKPRPGTYDYIQRGWDSQPDQDDVIVEARKISKRMNQVDKCLRKFKYHEALDRALSGDHRAPYVISIFAELARRNALEIALSSRDYPKLKPVLKFVFKFITDCRYAPVLIAVAELILDNYVAMIEECPRFARKLRALQKILREKMRMQCEMIKVLGAFDIAFAMAAKGAIQPGESDASKELAELERTSSNTVKPVTKDSSVLSASVDSGSPGEVDKSAIAIVDASSGGLESVLLPSKLPFALECTVFTNSSTGDDAVHFEILDSTSEA